MIPSANANESYYSQLERYQFNSVALIYKLKNKQNTYKTKCSGVIFDATTILTASHCVQLCDWEECDVMSEKDLKILRGKGVSSGIITADNYNQTNIHTVKRILANPYHVSINRHQWSSDIAIIKLNSPLAQNSFVPINIFPARELSLEYEHTHLKLSPLHTVVAGFGSQEDQDFKRIKYGELNIRATFGPIDPKSPMDFYLNSSSWQLHSKGSRNSFSICKGDSGGPIFMQFEGNDLYEKGWYLMGVLSTADFFSRKNENGTIIKSRCGLSEHTIIDYHMKWINWTLDLLAH
ncbi:MAG: trypsin-like serine protease [Halobacteriovoraceae bacterium]|nr:trypsin-like serine protease [Halobacteriovoraceae bacterium]